MLCSGPAAATVKAFDEKATVVGASIDLGFRAQAFRALGLRFEADYSVVVSTRSPQWPFNGALMVLNSGVWGV